MTVLALLSHALLVDVVLAMTVVTGRRRLPELLALCVASVTGGCPMLPFEREIRVGVVEQRRHEADDVGIAAAVFAMTLPTLAPLQLRREPMKPVLVADVRRDILVAGQALRAFRGVARLAVTLAAIILVLRVRRGQWPRHEQTLQRCRSGRAADEQQPAQQRSAQHHQPRRWLSTRR